MIWFCKGKHGIWAGCGGKQKQTNYDSIRAMTYYELADFLCKVACNATPVGYYHIEGWLDWLKQEID